MITHRPEYMTTAEVAQRFRVSVRTIHDWVKRGIMPKPSKIPGTRLNLWHRSVVDELLWKKK